MLEVYLLHLTNWSVLCLVGDKSIMNEHVPLHAPRAGRLAPFIVLSNNRVIPIPNNKISHVIV